MSRVFQHFGVWLSRIYRKASYLGVELSPEIRGVMDRLYAGESAVDQAERQAGEPLFKNPEEAGWTEEQYRNYADAHGMAVDKARQTVAAEMNAAAEREKTADFREEKGNVRDAVTEQIDARPEYTAIRSLRRGKLDDGTELTLSREALVQQYGEERVKALQQLHRGLYRNEGGVDADTAAEMFGFHSGEEMLRALEAAPRRPKAIEAATRDYLVNKYGDVRYDGTLNDRARFAIENDPRAGNLYRELRALKTRLAKVEQKAADTKAAMAAIALPPLEHYQVAAHDMIQSKASVDLQPYRYLNASRKFSRDAFEAAGKGDARRAFEAKNKELLNHFLFREAAKESEWFDKFEKQVQKSVTSRGIQQRMALGDAEDKRNGGVGDTRDQYNWLLARYKMGSGPKPARTLNDWAAQMYGDMMEPAIVHGILTEGNVKDYRSVPISELHDLSDALENIRHLSRMQYKVYVNGKLQDLNEAAHALAEGLRKNLPSKPVPVFEGKNAFNESRAALQGMDVWNTRMEFMMNKFDGGTRGPWHDYIWNQYQKAKGEEHALAHEVTQTIRDVMEAYRKSNGRRMEQKVMLPGMPPSEAFTMHELVSMALNMGNEGNRDRLLKTFQYYAPSKGWDPAAIGEIPRTMRREDWNLVQGLWDALKPIGERMVELEKRQTGLPPIMVKVEPFTVTLADGSQMELAGGYAPIRIDPEESLKGYDEEAGKTARNMMEKGYVRPTTSRSYTKERTGFGGALLFDYERVLSGHLTKAIKDITHREYAQSTYKLLTHPEVRQALKETAGRQWEAAMEPWLRSTVNNTNGSLDFGSGDPRPFMEKRRSNLIRASLAFKASTMLEQFTHLSRVKMFTGGLSYLKAMGSFWKNPAGVTETIRDLSPNVMRYRGEHLSRDYSTALEDIARKKGIAAEVSRFGMAAYKYQDHAISFPLWLAVYRDSLLKRPPEMPNEEASALAVHDADAAIRMGLGTGETGDLPPFLRSQDQLHRWLSMLSGFQNLGYNLVVHKAGDEAAREFRAGRYGSGAAKLTTGVALAWIIPNLVGAVASGHGPKKGENLGEWAMWQSLVGGAEMIYGLRNLAAAAEYGSLTPAGSFLKRGYEVGKGVKSDKEDKDWIGLGINALEFAGQYRGVPGTNQAAQMARYMHRANQGKIENPNVFGAVVGGGRK